MAAGSAYRARGSVPAVTWTTPPPEDRGAPAHAHHLHLPAGAHVADRRGLTATGAVALAFALGLVGAVIDLKTGRTLRTAFELSFVVGTALAAVLVHREDLKAAVVLAPYTYCGLAIVAGIFGRTSGHGSVYRQAVVALADALALHAPVLFLATGLAFVIVLVRRSRYRRLAPRP